MALKITKATDPITVDQLIMCIYAPPGVGKTSLGFTAEAPLLLDFDAGAYRAANRADSVPIKAWNDVAGMTADDLADYKTIIVDTAGRALDILSADIIQRNPKAGRGGALSLQGYGQLKSEFAAWAKMLRSFGKDLILVAHSDEQRSGDDLIERLDMQGSSKQEVYKIADAMGRLAFRGSDRVLDFSPSGAGFGKNPAQLELLRVPDFTVDPHYLAGIIERIKGKLNELTAEQSEVAELLAGWKKKVDGAKKAKDLTALVGELETLDSRITANAKRVLWDTAKGKGFTFDAEKKAFTEPVKEEKQEAKPEAV